MKVGSRGAADSRPEIVIVGAGVIGLAIGCELARRGRQVTIVERDRPGAGASTIAAGMLSPTSDANLEHPRLIEFAVDSLARYPEFIAGLSGSGIDVDYRRDGTLFVALNQDDEAELEYLASIQRERGLRSRRMDEVELREAEPYLSPRALTGLLIESDHHVDPRRLCAALSARFEQLGGTMLAPRSVNRVLISEGAARGVAGVSADGTTFELEAELTILAAGCWTSREIEFPGSELGLRPVRGQTLLLRGAKLLRHVIRHPEVYLVPRRNGDVLVGGTIEEMGFDSGNQATAIYNMLRWALALFPGLEQHQLIEVPVGLRPCLQDHMPIVGPGSARQLWLAVGHYRSGILLAPATAHYLAEWIETQEMPAPLAAFQARRLQQT